MNLRLLVLVAALALPAAVAPPAAALSEPLDEHHAAATARGGWLQRIGWWWAPFAAAAARDQAFPAIATIDTGVDAGHPEFRDAGIDLRSADCSRGRPVAAREGLRAVADPNGHGSIVAGLAAAPANGVGIVGVSPLSAVISVRVDPDTLRGVDCALHWLSAEAQRSGRLLVVNLSLADRDVTPRRRALVEALVRDGALVVAATGNGGRRGGPIGAPARLPHVLAVGDAERRERRPGRELDLLAPAGGLRAPDARGGWSPLTRPYTSWAAPLVAGAGAAVWGLHRGGSTLTAQGVAYLLRRGASGGGRWNADRGFGVVSLRGALRQPAPADDEREVNDSGPRAWASGPDPARCRRGPCAGIAGTTDDALDYWPVFVRRGERVWACLRTPRRGDAVLAGVWRGSRGRRAVGVRARRPLVTYRLRVQSRACAGGLVIGP